MEGKKIDKKKQTTPLVMLGIFALIAIILILWLNWYFLHDRIAHDSLNDRGTFGDMFGFSTALFSGLAFAGIILTIWMQKEELSLQRRELSDTREVLKNQANQLEQQSRTLIAQKDENTFFQLLKLHNDIVENIKIDLSPTSSVTGKKALERISAVMTHNIVRGIKGKALDVEVMCDLYKEQYKINESILGHYFRLLYHIVKFVNFSQLEDKKIYTNIVRAQLSQPELVLIYFNCMSSYGREKFKPLVEKYALLKAMSFDGLKELGDEESLRSHYKKKAFK